MPPDAPLIRSPNLLCLTDVEPEEVRFLWKPYLPDRKVAILEGDPGLGKTWTAIQIGAAISRGWPLPGSDGKPTVCSIPESVVYISAEDGIADTLRVRFERAGADLDLVSVLDGFFDEKRHRYEFTLADLDVLERVFQICSPRLVVIDPIQGFLGAGVDMHRANEVRPLLAGLSRLAQEYRCVVLVIRHFRKSTTDRAIYRGLGSIDFAAHARSILMVGNDPEVPGRRVLAHTKSNLAPEGQSLAFEIVDGEFRWVGLSEYGPEELLAAGDGSEKRPHEEAKNFLRDVLEDGPVDVPDIKKLASAAGISWRTLERAKAALRVVSKRHGFGQGAGYRWALPDHRPPTPPYRESGGPCAETDGDPFLGLSLDDGGGL